ncbi:uracil phosphoribosyltransferase [Striga asiatica]|uniref:Uracil phosphoribosyltransferase n=1 Tax=Striga asiatica TaxID=4170 RepID=A0A5A7PG15_STRAF|nr:uracil phosphoribosyltransferase [Striga asiatica]
MDHGCAKHHSTQFILPAKKAKVEKRRRRQVLYGRQITRYHTLSQDVLRNKPFFFTGIQHHDNLAHNIPSSRKTFMGISSYLCLFTNEETKKAMGIMREKSEETEKKMGVIREMREQVEHLMRYAPN